MESEWIMKDFDSIHHNDVSAMNSLSFFLGSSAPSAFHGINGYFFNARVYTQNSFKSSAPELS